MKINSWIILITICLNTAFANSDDSPALPPLENSKNEEKIITELPKPRSFFQKLKNLFRFQQEVEKPATTSSETETHLAENTPTDQEPFIDLNKVKLPELQTTQETSSKELEIPAGFSDQQTQDAADKSITSNEQKAENLPPPSSSPSTTLPKETLAVAAPSLSTSEQSAGMEAAQESKAESENNQNSPAPPSPPIETTSTTVNDSLPSSRETISTVNVPAAPKVEQDFDQKAPLPSSNNENKELSTEQAKFVSDEAKVLLLPNDDIVMGELSEQAKLEQMDFYSYVALFNKLQNWNNRFPKRAAIENFITNYESNFNAVKPYTSKEISNYAFAAIKKDNLFELRALLDNFQILQTLDDNGNTLLHQAVKEGNYRLVKFLIMRGINLSAYNASKQTPLMIAEKQGYDDIARLLRKTKIAYHFK